MIDKIQEKIVKYETLEREAGNRAEFNMIGEFLGDLGKLLENAKEKKKACCEKKTTQQVAVKSNERWIKVTCCRTCPYSMYSLLTSSPYCIKNHVVNIVNFDAIDQFCPLRRENEAV